MLTLHTLGRAFLSDAAGEPLGGAATHRRTLALLSVLAVAGDAGLSRDKLVGLLWPESDSERARHSLTQALYSARRALGADNLIVAGTDIRLNAERIASDVSEFQAALDADDLERAVALYQGPFLDGFFFAGSPEFEQWSASQRQRLEARAIDALERLARGAEERRDYRQAVDWRQRLAALRPLDSGSAVKLMTVLALAGDRAGALQHARVHETLLREELQLEPDPVVTALATKLRDPVAWVPDVPRVDPPAPPGQGEIRSEEGSARVTQPDNDAVATGPLTAASTDKRIDPAVRRPTPPVASAPRPARGPVQVWIPARRGYRWLPRAAALLFAGFLVGIGVVVGRARRSSPSLRELAPRQRVVVAPFRVAGADPSLAYLRDGIVELLSARLADDTAARSVDAGAVLGAWRAAGLSAAVDVPRTSVVRLAAQLGAERVVIGGVVGTPPRVIIRATALTVPSGAVSGEATATGPADSLTTLIDRLAARLLASEAGEEEQLASYTSRSLPALRAYLAGQAAFREGDYTAAQRQYGIALRYDSTFALAALRSAVTAEQLGDNEQVRRDIAAAWPSREALGERDRALLVAFAGPRYPTPSTITEQRAAWQRVVDLAPTSAESWFALGMRLYHDGPIAAVPAPQTRAAAAFERALSADPSYLPARRFLTQIAGVSYSPGQAAGMTPDALGPFAPFLRWRTAMLRGDTAELRTLRDSLSLLGPANLRAIAMASQYDAMGVADGSRALGILEDRPARTADRLAVLLGRHALALNRGRPRDALAATMQLQRLQPGSQAALRLRVLDALYAEGDSSAAAAAARQLASVTGREPAAVPTTSETWLANVCVLAQWRLARGDTTDALSAITALQARPSVRHASPVSTAPRTCAALLDGWLGVVTRSSDARVRVQRLDSLALTPQVAGDASTYAHVLLARLHQRLGNGASALAAVRRRPYMAEWPTYLTTAWRDEGLLAERAGEVDGAREAYRRYLVLRDEPEAEIAPQVDEVRRLLERLTASPR